MGGMAMAKALFILYLIWGFNWVVMKEATLFFPPVLFSCYRFVIGAVVLIGITLWCRMPLPPKRYWTWIIATGLLQIAVNNAAIQIGVTSLGAGLVAVVNYSMPVWMSILAYFILHETLTKRKILGIVLSMVGMYVLMDVEIVGDITGLLLTIGGAIAWAIAAVIVKYQDKVMHRQQQKETCTMIQYTTWQIAAGALFLWVYAMLFEQGQVTWTPMAVSCLAYNGVLASALAFFLWNYILTKMEASKAGVASLGVPVVGVICNVIFMHEAVHWNTAVGMVLILAGIFLIVAQRIRQHS